MLRNSDCLVTYDGGETWVVFKPKRSKTNDKAKVEKGPDGKFFIKELKPR